MASGYCNRLYFIFYQKVALILGFSCSAGKKGQFWGTNRPSKEDMKRRGIINVAFLKSIVQWP
jgi:hypothetical protein